MYNFYINVVSARTSFDSEFLLFFSLFRKRRFSPVTCRVPTFMYVTTFTILPINNYSTLINAHHVAIALLANCILSYFSLLDRSDRRLSERKPIV